jgi:hypothetical protein
MRYRKEYNWKNWTVGDRVKTNPDFAWGDRHTHKWERKGTVKSIDTKSLEVLWDDNIDCYYSYACSSLIKINENIKIDLLPDSLFEI